MKHFAMIFVLFFCAMGAAQNARAQANLINFDDVLDGTVVDTFYAARGVTFTNPVGGSVYARDGSGFAPSPPNVVSIFQTGLPDFYAFFGAVDATFSTPQLTVSIDARPVSTFEPLGTPFNRPFLEAYSGATFLGRVLYQGALPTGVREVGPTETLTFTSATANITRVRFSVQQNQGGPRISGLFDNLSFSATNCTPAGFSATGSMGTPRLGHTATALADGKVLIAGGTDAGGIILASAVVYDPAAGTFTATSPMTTARTNHTATLLLDGRVLITGGSGGGVSAELFDPATATFSPTGSMSDARFWGHTANLLGDGTVLIAGGTNSATTFASAEIYDPATGIFTPTGSLGTPRQGHTATGLPDGTILIAGGGDGGFNVYDTAEIYDPIGGIFTPTSSMGTARQSHAATALADGRVLITGGGNSGTFVLATAEIYDPVAAMFSPAGSMTTQRGSHTGTLLPSGKVLLAGGHGFGGAMASAELYDPAAGTFAGTGAMSTTRRAHAATLLPNCRVLVAGGANSAGATLASAEVYKISSCELCPP